MRTGVSGTGEAYTGEQAELLARLAQITGGTHTSPFVISASNNPQFPMEKPKLTGEEAEIAERSLLYPVIYVKDDKLWVKHPQHLYSLRAVAVEIGGKWEAREKAYSFPLYVCYALHIEEAYANFRLEASESYLNWIKGREPDVPEDMPQWVKKVYDQLYPFQQEAVRWITDHPYDHPGLLLALSPGLGKTVVALTALNALGLQRVLIIAPLSLLRVWEFEAVKWFGTRRATTSAGWGPPPLVQAHGSKPPKAGWVVTNYNTVTSPNLAAEYWEQAWDALVLDESVMVKNRKTQRFANIKNLRDSADMVLLLSGSPITKHPDDLWAQFHIIEPRGFKSYWKFTKRYCMTERNVWAKGGYNVTGSKGIDLPNHFKDIMFVKNQEEVLPDLPEMIFQLIPCRMTHKQNTVYDRMLKEFIATLESVDEELDATTKLAQLTRLQQIASNVFNLNGREYKSFKPVWPDESGKDETILELLEADSVEFPLLIWTHWTPGAVALYKKLFAAGHKVAHIIGSHSKEETDAIFEEYKTGKVDILIVSMGVGKFGHTLTNTSTVMYKDKTWSADNYVQSLYRVRRIGLTHVPRVISLNVPLTIDDLVEDNLAGKMVDIAKVTNSDLLKLLKGLNRGHS